MITIICYICKKKFKIFPYRKNTIKYCSRKCKHIGQKEQQGFWKGKKLSKKHIRNLSKSHKGKFTGSNSPQWKGGRIKDEKGYIRIYKPNHPFCNPNGYIYEHRFVLEQKIGRILTTNEIAHHINEIRDDNRPENLKLFNKSTHPSYHSKMRYSK